MRRVMVGQTLAVEFDGSDTTLLNALERKQFQVNFQCREGYCGACRCKLLEGEVKYLHEPLAFVRRGEFLPCCSVPLTDIQIAIP